MFDKIFLPFLIISAIAIPLSLTACTPQTSAQLITAIQQAAITGCQFLPTAETVTQLILAGNIQASAGLTQGAAIAEAICKTVGQAPPPPSSSTMLEKKAIIPMINNIPIHGQFITIN